MINMGCQMKSAPVWAPVSTRRKSTPNLDGWDSVLVGKCARETVPRSSQNCRQKPSKPKRHGHFTGKSLIAEEKNTIYTSGSLNGLVCTRGSQPAYENYFRNAYETSVTAHERFVNPIQKLFRFVFCRLVRTTDWSWES